MTGRPRKGFELMDHMVRVRVTKQTWKRVQAAAKKNGMSPSDWLRDELKRALRMENV